MQRPLNDGECSPEATISAVPEDARTRRIGRTSVFVLIPAIIVILPLLYLYLRPTQVAEADPQEVVHQQLVIERLRISDQFGKSFIGDDQFDHQAMMDMILSSDGLSANSGRLTTPPGAFFFEPEVHASTQALPAQRPREWNLTNRLREILFAALAIVLAAVMIYDLRFRPDPH